MEEEEKEDLEPEENIGVSERSFEKLDKALRTEQKFCVLRGQLARTKSLTHFAVHQCKSKKKGGTSRARRDQ